jgi:hypothetical protein
MPVKRPNEEQRPAPDVTDACPGDIDHGHGTDDPVTPATMSPMAPDGRPGTVAAGSTVAPANDPEMPASIALDADAAANTADDHHAPGDHPASVLARL